jgi:hypothetical protein
VGHRHDRAQHWWSGAQRDNARSDVEETGPTRASCRACAHERRRVPRYQPAIAFPSIESLLISDISMRTPTGSVVLVMNEIVRPTRGSSTVTPRRHRRDANEKARKKRCGSAATARESMCHVSLAT